METGTDAEPARILFDPQDYLTRHFTGGLDANNTVVLRFYADIYRDLGGRSLLEFGGGPTIYAVTSAARTAGWIHFTDYSPACLNEITKWLAADETAFDWSDYTRYTLRCEQGDGHEPSEQEVQARHALLRQHIRLVSRCDAWAPDPLLGASLGPYGAVAVNFCLEALTDDKGQWLLLNQKIAGLVDEKGLFVTTALWNVPTYIHAGRRYPSTALTPADISDMYEALGFGVTHLETAELRENYGYIMACGQRL